MLPLAFCLSDKINSESIIYWKLLIKMLEHMSWVPALSNIVVSCFISWWSDIFECHDREETEIELEQVCDGTDDCEGGEDESIWACAEKNGWLMLFQWCTQ